ncbi:MAG: YraN family protein [Moorellaceae bacterium]
MTLGRRQKGQQGEAAAASFLLKNGYRLLEQNFRCALGEIDVVAEDKGEIVFVEVKARFSHLMGAPQEAVDWRKQKRLHRLAAYYLQRRGLSGRPCRFDVVAVWLDKTGEAVQIELIRGAF